MAFVCRRTVRVDAIYQLKINYDQDKFGVFFLRRKTFPFEDKHAVNEHHVARKREKMFSRGAIQSTT